ncbi:replication initiation and membrane attachment family protein [Bacillus daqingensis]|uniref:Replication initiation and membrane attachment family protein n=1 Tax=Bacillus daqingensis TaxID=872396 RepID=A0ABV9NZP4_9BACI
MRWQDIQPATPFTAVMSAAVPDERVRSLTLLYQPLIGPVAYSLYMMLASEISMSADLSIRGTHKQWMTHTGQPLPMLADERRKLEAMGLLDTFKKQEDGDSVYLYELKQPLSPADFFADDLLSVYLYNRIGSRERYRRLRESFSVHKADKSGFEKVTQGFDEVFTSIHPSEMRSTSGEMADAVSSASILQGSGDEASFSFGSEELTLEEIAAHLPPFVKREELYTEINETCIRQIAFLYRYSAEEIAYLIQDAMLHTDHLDVKELREAAKRRYRLQENGKPPMLGMRSQPPQLRTVQKEPATDEERQIQYFETTSPLEYLHALSDGAKVFPGDVDIIEELMADYGLPAGVVNVLIDYLYIVNNGNLAKGLAFKIATQWKRKKVKTVSDAMALAKQEHEGRKNYEQKQKQPQGKQVKQPLPKWMQEPQEEKKQDEQSLQRARQEAEKYKALLREKKEKRGG